MNIINNLRQHSVCYIVFSLLILPPLLFVQYLLKNIPLVTSDFISQYYIWQSYLVNSLRDGRLPLWNPHVLSGTPFLANPQMAVFYPFHWLKIPFANNGLLSFPFYQLFILLEIGLGLVLFFCLVKFLTKQSWLAFYAAIIYGLSPIFITILLDFSTALSTVIWWPLILLWSELYLLKRQSKFLMLLSVTLAVSWLAGHPSIFIYNLIGLIIYWLIRMKRREIGRLFLRLMLVLTVTFGLVAVQLIPAFEFLNLASRSSITYPTAETTTSLMGFLTSLITPDGYNKIPITLGVITLFFVILTISQIKKDKLIRRWWTFLLATAIFLIILVIILPSLEKIPLIYNLMRYYHRLLYLPMTALAILGALGFRHYISLVNIRSGHLYLTFIIYAIISLAIVSLGAPIKSIYLTAVSLILLMALSAWLSWRPNLTQVFRLMIILISLATVFVNQPKLIWPKNQSFDSYASNKEIYHQPAPLKRVATGDNKFIMNYAMISKYYNTNGYYSLYIKNYNDLRALWPTGLTNTAGLLSETTVSPPVWQEQSALPRFWLIQQVNILPDEQTIINELTHDFEQLRTTGLITGRLDWEDQPSSIESQIDVISYQPEKFELSYAVDQPSILVINDNYYPGWQARIDDGKEEIFPINHYMRGIKVPAGQHQVIITYRPLSFYLGLIISLTTLTGLTIYLYINKRRQRYFTNTK
ncbi:MAG: YfhO family protein [Patescibacteria group bacterium]